MKNFAINFKTCRFFTTNGAIVIFLLSRSFIVCEVLQFVNISPDPTIFKIFYNKEFQGSDDMLSSAKVASVSPLNVCYFSNFMAVQKDLNVPSIFLPDLLGGLIK